MYNCIALRTLYPIILYSYYIFLKILSFVNCKIQLVCVSVVVVCFCLPFLNGVKQWLHEIVIFYLVWMLCSSIRCSFYFFLFLSVPHACVFILNFVHLFFWVLGQNWHMKSREWHRDESLARIIVCTCLLCIKRYILDTISKDPWFGNRCAFSCHSYFFFVFRYLMRIFFSLSLSLSLSVVLFSSYHLYIRM